MLNDLEYDEYINISHTLSHETKKYLDQVRNSDPARMVGTHAKSNVCSFVPSKKMGHVISTESRTVEKAFVTICEYDSDVLEIWDQPEPIEVFKTDKRNRRRRQTYTPDFLLLTTKGPKVVEAKSRDNIAKLIEQYPSDWERSESGEVIFNPAREAFLELGIPFEVFEYSKDMAYFVENIRLLLKSRVVSDSNLNVRNLDKAFEQSFCWTLHDMKEHLNLNSYSPLFKKLDSGDLYTDLNTCLLSVPRGCQITRSKETYRLLKGSISGQVLDNSMAIPRGVLPSHSDAQIALIRIERIQRGEKGSSISRWKKKIKDAKKQGISEFEALLPNNRLKGNRSRKINIEVETYLLKYLEEKYACQQGISKYRSYVQYCVLAKKQHPSFSPVSRQTFTRRIDQMPEGLVAYQRGGRRKANALASPSSPQERAIKSQRAWECAAIDHYLADVFLVVHENSKKRVVERAWVTLMIDIATSTVLAVSVSFLPPSKRSCVKVLRECVRRHGKLPDEIIVDRGSDFKSTLFAAVLAHLSITLSYRPAGHSRFGGEVEGFFGEFKKDWLSQRQGNLLDYKEQRSVDGKKSPRNSAVLRPHDFIRELREFCIWRSEKCRGGESLSAMEKFYRDEKDFGFLGTKIKYDQEFLIATSIDVKKYKINFQRGIHIASKWYWSHELAALRGICSHVEVRLDPENPTVTYALISDKWVPCYSSDVNVYEANDQDVKLEKGLLQLELMSVREKIKLEDDKKGSELIQEMNELLEKKEPDPRKQISTESGSDEASSVFSGLNLSETNAYDSENWRNS